MNINNHKVYKVDTPCKVEVGFYTNIMAKKASSVDGVKRISDREILIEGDDFIKVITKTWKAITMCLLKTPDWMG